MSLSGGTTFDPPRYPRSFVSNKGVHAAVVAQAQLTPERIALRAADQRFTYAELLRSASNMAAALRTFGVAEDDRVAIHLDRTADLPVSILAVLLAGGTYVPMDAGCPPERVRKILELCDCSTLITSQDGASLLPSTGTSVIPIDELQHHASAMTVESLTMFGNSSRLAYIMFTSGSTGEPKGVAMPHGPLVRLVQWQNSRGLGPVTTLQFAPVGFDVSAQELFSTWSNGGTLVMIDEPTRKDPMALLQQICAQSIERAFLPAAILRYLCQAAERTNNYPDSLRQVITAGEALELTEDICNFFQRLPECRLVNQYGPTESHVVTSFDVDLLEDYPATRPPIGRPLPGVTIYLVNEAGQLVADGSTGEIFIGGSQLADGYFNQPTLTTQRFVPDPLHANRLVYRTGDLARRRPDGHLEFLGRVDRQVKIRGYRVEPDEVAAVLRSDPRVTEAAVVVMDCGVAKQLAAAVTLSAEASISEQGLVQIACRRLPDFMVPSQIRILPRMPLTTNGKIDHDKLQMEMLNRGTDVDDAPLSSKVDDYVSLESTLRQLWQELLAHQAIGKQDSFFELGGDSIRAMELVARVEQRWSTRISIADFVADPTISYLIRRISGSLVRGEDALWFPLKSQGGQSPFFWAPPAGGNALVYLPLAQGWTLDRPFYACRYPEDEAISGSIPNLARHLIKAMQKRYPTGPYFLGGWSLGGSVAYEMACQLTEAGHGVASLVLIDTGIMYSIAVMRAVVPASCGLYETMRLSGDDKLRHLAKPFESCGLVPSHLPDHQKLQLVETVLRNSCALWDYRPRHYRGHVQLILGRETFTKTRHDPYEEWKQIAAEVDRHYVDGNHLTLMSESNRQSLLETLASCLDGERSSHVVNCLHHPLCSDQPVSPTAKVA